MISHARQESDTRDELVAPAPSHEVARLERAVRENIATLWRLGRRWGLSSADSEDVAQSAVVIFSRRLPQIEVGRERAFLCQTALRLASNARRSVRARAQDSVESWEKQSGELPNPEELLQESRARAELDAIIAQLPETHRAAFVLFELELLTQAEVADALQIPQGTVASRIRKARKLVEASIERNRQRSIKLGASR